MSFKFKRNIIFLKEKMDLYLSQKIQLACLTFGHLLKTKDIILIFIEESFKEKKKKEILFFFWY